MSRIAERDLLGICVSCISYHIMSQLHINMHVLRFLSSRILRKQHFHCSLGCSVIVESVLFGHVRCQLFATVLIGKKTFLSFAQTRLFVSQILLDLFGQLNPSLSKSCTLMVSRSRMNRLGCKKLMSEFAGPRSGFEKPPSKCYINHSNWLKAFIYFFVFFF